VHLDKEEQQVEAHVRFARHGKDDPGPGSINDRGFALIAQTLLQDYYNERHRARAGIFEEEQRRCELTIPTYCPANQAPTSYCDTCPFS